MNSFITTRHPISFAIPDLQTGCEMIARWPLSNPTQAATELERWLDCLWATPPDSDTLFRLLEHAYSAASFIAEELAKRYLNKALPLGELEDAVFQRTVSIWLRMSRAYAQCAESVSVEAVTTQQTQRLAPLLQRCIYYTGMAIVEHQHARREYTAGLWLDLHGFFARAETLGVDKLDVPDRPENSNHATHCAATYLSLLLSEMAGSYGLSLRQQVMLRRWSIQWAQLTRLERFGVGEALPPQLVNLKQDSPLQAAGDGLSTDHFRRIESARLVAHINQLRLQLRQRIPPSQLALGEDCTAGQCQRLLEHLSRAWSQAKVARKFRRRATSGIAKLCTEFDEMYYFVCGQAFEQPENVLAYSRREFDALFTFRHQVDSSQALHLPQEQRHFSTDHWDVVNQSANGFRLMRSVAGRKMTHGQLIALCPHDGNRFILAKNTWLMQKKDGGLIAGLEALPGLPVAIAARILESSGTPAGKYHPAFLLPATPAAASEQSLILPSSWYRPRRVLELFTDGVWQVKLTQVIDDGPGFERVGFVIC